MSRKIDSSENFNFDRENRIVNSCDVTGLASQALDRFKPTYLEGLNNRQYQGVTHLDGPVLMLAGAGTGKTRALTARIAHIIHTRKAYPNQILAVTFTNKAAKEMKMRLGQYVGSRVDSMPWLGTFHSICVKILRSNPELVGLKPDFTILDTDDQIRLLKQLIKLEKIDEKKWPARFLASIIDGWKNRALKPTKVPQCETNKYDGKGTKLYELYQERLKFLNAVDFGDLLLHALEILTDNSEILSYYQDKLKYVLVDEYQDTNIAQYLWLRLLAQKHKNICCVGDDDQSIYGWRGAEVGNILKFEKDFKDATIIRLEQNYRSTPYILNAASKLISANKGRLGKTLWTNETTGAKIRLVGHWDGEEEAHWIGDEVEAFSRGTRGFDPIKLSKQAILVRASFQMRAFEDRFLAIGLSYRVVGGPRFYERSEIRDAISYLRIVVSPDDSLAFERIINTPKRGLGEKTQQEIIKAARSKNTSLLNSARNFVTEKKLSAKAGFGLSTLIFQIDNWRNELRKGKLTHYELAGKILDESGYTEMWQNDNSPSAPGRLENLKELVKGLEEFENIQGFLEHISLMMDNDKEDGTDKVSLMTLHAAKGLEFSAVFLPGWEEGLFPSQRSMDESGLKGLEEERRLAYVGITRAEEHCTISFAANRRVYNQWQAAAPSRFINDLSKDDVEVITPPALYGGNFGAASGYSYKEEVTEVPNPDDKYFEGKTTSTSELYNSPGWRRMRNHSVNLNLNNDLNPHMGRMSNVSLEIGEKVFHQKFGYGNVALIEGDTISVSFQKSGDKKVKSNYLLSKDLMP